MKTYQPEKYSRRKFVQSAGALAALAPATALAQEKPQGTATNSLPPAFEPLKPLGSRVKPINSEEYQARIARAQQLLAKQNPKLDALFVATGTSLYYFTGVHWWASERLLGLLIPQKCEPIVVCAAFEEGRFREQLRFPAEVHVWQEDESPTKLAANALADRGLRKGRIGVEGAIQFTFYNQFREYAPGVEYY